MDSTFDSTLLLDRFYALPRGPMVRLRMARSSDAPAIRELAARRQLDADALEVARLTRFDPRHRIVICATALIDAHETFVGVGAMEVDAGDPPEPDTLIVDLRIDGLGELLVKVLVGRARTIARQRAA
jgi:N-acetylglutamate synthase-like GNAT family acetyltransferase